MRFRSTAIPAAGVGLMALLLAGCTSTASTGGDSTAPAAAPGAATCDATFDGEKVVFTVSNVIEGFAPLLVAMESGAFEEVGLDVTIEKIPAADSLAAIAQGRYDGQLTSYSAGNLNAGAEGLEMMWVAPFYELPVDETDVLPGYWADVRYVGTGPKPDLSGLEGQLISSPTAGSGAGGLLLQDAFAEFDMTVADITFTTASGVDSLIGLENGAVAAAWLSSPFDQEAAQNPNLRLAATYPAGLNGSGLIVGPSMLDRPEVLTKVLQVMAEVADEYLQGDYYDNDETVGYLAAALGVERDLIGKGEPLIFDSTLDMTDSGAYVASLQTFMRGQGSLTYADDLPAEALVDAQYAKVAAGCLG